MAESLASAFRGLKVEITDSVADAASGANGLVNCTPLGMAGYGGAAFSSSVIGGQRWAFFPPRADIVVINGLTFSVIPI